MCKNLTVIVGYIMYYDMLENVNGSFFTKIDKAVELAEEFYSLYKKDEEEGWVERDYEETLNDFVINKTSK